MENTNFYTPPTYELSAFNCPTCGAYAHQEWSIVIDENKRCISQLKIARCEHCTFHRGSRDPATYILTNIYSSTYSIWYKEKLIYPDIQTVPPPNSDLNPDIVEIYNEARSILHRSPRGAAALLRLCVEKLCDQLDVSGKDLNEKIGNLVKDGLPVRIQQALDSARVIGNNFVHGGQIVLEDNQKTATQLFGLINFIAHRMITQEKEIQEIYDNSLTQSQLDSIRKRDQQP